MGQAFDEQGRVIAEAAGESLSEQMARTVRVPEALIRRSQMEAAGERPLMNRNIAETKRNTPDLEVYGDGDAWRLICKASSRSGGWMKSTKAMEIPGAGCLVQVTTQHEGQIAEAVTFVPGVYVGLVNGIPRLLSEAAMPQAVDALPETRHPVGVTG